eukprot:424874-Amphidinium_carterae.1
MAPEGHPAGPDGALPAKEAGVRSRCVEQPRGDPMASDWGVCLRQGVGGLRGQDKRNEPQHVPAPSAVDAESSKRKATVVHMHGVRETLGE